MPLISSAAAAMPLLNHTKHDERRRGTIATYGRDFCYYIISFVVISLANYGVLWGLLQSLGLPINKCDVE